jgi:PhnB protein
MKPLVPYLFFNGNCREAMEFYRACFGGKLEMMTYAQSPDPERCKPGDEDKIMHALLAEGDFALMASDNPVAAPAVGDNISLSAACVDGPATDRLFAALGEGGKVAMPLEKTFWGAYFGMLVDRYGIHWMLSCPVKT